MCHGMSVRQKFATLVCLLTPLYAASDQPTWDHAYSQGLAAFDAGHYDEALPSLINSLDLARALPSGNAQLVKSAYTLALTYQLQGEPAQAEPLFLEAKTAVEAMGASGRTLSGYVLDGLGELRLNQGRWKDAGVLLRQAVSQCRETHGETHPCTLAAERHLGELLVVEGSTIEAQNLFEHLLATLRQTPSAPPDFLAGTMGNLAALFITENRFDLAEPLLRESLALTNQNGVSGPVRADVLLDLGELYRLEHDSARAEPLLKKALCIYETANDTHQAGALNELGLIALDEGKFAIAKGYLSQSLRIYQKIAGTTHLLTARVKAGLAQAFLGERDIQQARTLIREALTTERQSLGDKHSDYARLLMIAGRVEETGHRRAEADTYYRQALDVYRESLADGHPERTGAERNYARFAKSLQK
jgi:tetratricopeptide (TPR) repeat protein